MGWLDRVQQGIANWLLNGLDDAMRQRQVDIALRRDYVKGDQRRQLKKSANFDDNLTINYTSLIVDRTVTLMLGKGIEFQLPDGQEAAKEWLDAAWAANRVEGLLHNAAMLAAESGTGFIKILPGGQYGEDGIEYPRLVVLDPIYVTMESAPEDKETIVSYTIGYTISVGGATKSRKQVHSLNESGTGWEIVNYEYESGRWAEIERLEWGYPFPAIVHWQNLPDPTDIYGEPDITEDVLRLQDRINFVASNISKQIRLFAHPQRWGKNLGNAAKINMGPDEMPVFTGDSAEINQLDPLSDLTGEMAYLQFLRQSLMDTTQTIDFSSMADKLGTLTNFGLRVLTNDAMARLGTKRELFGDAIEEINRRMLIITNKGDQGGEVIWPDPLPVNEMEQQTALKGDLDMGIVSKETVATKRGYDWEEEQQRMEGEQSSQDNVGAALLRAFNRDTLQPGQMRQPNNQVTNG